MTALSASYLVLKLVYMHMNSTQSLLRIKNCSWFSSPWDVQAAWYISLAIECKTKPHLWYGLGLFIWKTKAFNRLFTESFVISVYLSKKNCWKSLTQFNSLEFNSKCVITFAFAQSLIMMAFVVRALISYCSKSWFLLLINTVLRSLICFYSILVAV